MTPDATESLASTATQLRRRKSYVQMTVGRLAGPGRDPAEDGGHLARQCLDAIDDPSRFPPRLFILLATAAFRPYQCVLAGIRNVLFAKGIAEVPLVGSSVAVCLFDGEAHPEGALLVCLASRFLSAKAAVAGPASRCPSQVVQEVLAKIGAPATLSPQGSGSQWLLTFLPGFAAVDDPDRYTAGEIQAELRRQTHGALPMFGGVSSGYMDSEPGLQFFDDGVYADAAVVTAVTSQISHAIASSHGISETGLTYRIEESLHGGRVITAFREGSPEEVMAQIAARVGEPCLFAQEGTAGDLVITMPRLKDNRLYLTRSLRTPATVHVLKPEREKMIATAQDRVDWLMRRLGMRRSRAVGCLAIASVERYRAKEPIGLDVATALRQATERLPGEPCVGCYMDGEIGDDELGQSLLGNWGLSMSLFADDISTTSEFSLGFDALALQTQKASRAESVDRAIAAILESVDRAGYPGGMVSLVLRDRKERWIVAHSALGEPWTQAILPLTRRALPGDDVLALVAEAREPRYVRDSSDPGDHCNRQAVQAGKIISQYIIPLQDETGQVIALLQIDLGDMRDTAVMGREQKTVLDALGNAAAAVLSRAIRTEELELARKLDAALARCLDARTADAAAERFIQAATAALQTDAHIRLRVPGTRSLRLVAGVGEYADAARKLRLEIDIHDESPSAHVARFGQPLHCNDARNDPAAQAIRARYRDTPVAAALEKQRAYANIPIAIPGGQPIGVVNISSRRAWFFTESTLRSLADLGSRLFVLLTHIEYRQAKERLATEQRFLLDITTRTEEETTLHEALQRQADAIRDAIDADTVSCFLWDDDRNRFMLRAQCGWAERRWVDAAWYGLGEGIAGRLAAGREARHIPDLGAFTREVGSGSEKYLKQMFASPPSEDETVELIALPMYFGDRSIGVWTLYRRSATATGNRREGFPRYNPETLQKAAEIVAAHVFAVQREDFLRWKNQEVQRLALTASLLLRERPLSEILSDLCLMIACEYGARVCAVYLPSDDKRTLQLVARHASAPATLACAESVSAGDSPIWTAFTTRRDQEIRYPAAGNPDDLREAKRDGLVWRACLPLHAAGQTLGALDICWQGAPAETESRFSYHDMGYLALLASRCASAIYTHQLRMQQQQVLRERLQWQQALNGMTANLRLGLHDLANGVGRMTNTLEKLKHTQPTQEQSDLISTCQDHVDGIDRVLRRALNAAGRLADLQRTECQLDTLVRETLKAYEPSLERTGITVSDHLETIQVTIDKTLLRDALENVIDNAIRAMPKGGRLQVSLRSDKSTCEVAVADTGVGMTPERLARVTNWAQLEGRSSGDGLGLFLARLHCKVHGGDLKVHSTPNVGTVVHLSIPLDLEWKKT